MDLYGGHAGRACGSLRLFQLGKRRKGPARLGVRLGLGIAPIELDAGLPWIGVEHGRDMLKDDSTYRNTVVLDRLDVLSGQNLTILRCFVPGWDLVGGAELNRKRVGNVRRDRLERHDAGLRDIGLDVSGQAVAAGAEGAVLVAERQVGGGLDGE